MRLINLSKNDTNKVNVILNYAFELENTNTDSALIYYYKAKTLCEELNFKTGHIRCYFNISYLLNTKGEYKKGLYANLQSIRESYLLKNDELLAKSFFNAAASYTYLNNYNKAIAFYNIAAKQFEKTGNKKNLILLYSNIASCYNNFSNSTIDTIVFNKSIKQYNKAILISREINDSVQLSQSLINISNSYINSAKYSQALITINEAILIGEITNNNYLSTLSYNVLGDCYYNLGTYNLAIEYGNKALIKARESGLINEVLNAMKLLSKAYLNFNQIKKSDFYITSAILICDSLGLINDKNNLLMTYSRVKFESMKYKEAYLGLYQHISLSDSINNENMKKQFADIETKYQTEKKELQIKTQSLEIDSQEKQNKQKSLIILFGTLALIGTGFFATMAFINFRKSKKANIIIENQKLQVELKNEEVTHQKEIVEEKQKEIIDSINYAKRIQQAVLTGEDVWNKVSKEHFILFKPKDIVSGDFYWAYNTPNNRSVFALVDCTGHGVPGGFMSMLGNSFLNEIVIENKIFKANEILNKLRSKIISALEQKGGTQQKDGMDISLCVWNKLDNTLEFAGANNPLWIIKTVVSSSGVENKQLLEYKADKMPIGTYLETEVPFSSTLIQLQKGDVIYLSTDGYADQFGGPKGKKLKYKPLIQLLITNSNLDIISQKTKLEDAFNLWQGSIEQVDDVAIIGIRV